MAIENLRIPVQNNRSGLSFWTTAIMVLAVAACDQGAPRADADSSLSRDLTLATAAAPTGFTPSLADTAVTTRSASSSQPSRTPSPPAVAPVVTPKAPVRAPLALPPSPSVRPPASEPAPTVAPTGAPPVAEGGAKGTARRAIGSGSVLDGRTSSEVCSLANKPGDRLVAALHADVVATDGTRLPAGTPILVEMATPGKNETFAFRVKAVQVAGVLIPIEGTVEIQGDQRERQVSKGGDRSKVIGGAVAGAILGRVLGGGTKGTIIGAAGGAAAGTMAAARNTVTEQCLPSGATLTVTLTAPLVLTEGVP